MAELTTVARPYAEALYRLAKESGSVNAWSETLALLSLVAEDGLAAQFVANPRFSAQQVHGFLGEMLGDLRSTHVDNFIVTLVQNRRFALLPRIAHLFEALKSEDEGAVEAHIESAFELLAEQLDQLTATLAQRFKRSISAKVTVSPALIGGVRMTVGDDVIDASVRGKLAAMTASLTS